MKSVKYDVGVGKLVFLFDSESAEGLDRWSKNVRERSFLILLGG